MPRRAQHRQKRDGNTREVAELRKEVKTLMTQLARAHRENEKLGGNLVEEPEEVIEAPKAQKASCPKCQESDKVVTFQTPGGKKLVGCGRCKNNWSPK